MAHRPFYAAIRNPDRQPRLYSLLVFFGALTCLIAGDQAGATKPADPKNKKLIAWGGIDWYSPETVRDHLQTIEQLPFDGIVMQGFKARKNGEAVAFDWLCYGDQAFTRDELAPAIETLSAIRFQKFTDNFLRYNVTPGNVDWFDNYDPILHNAGLWAQITHELGFKGWAFDVEDYRGTVFDYRKQKYRDSKSFTEYATQARMRGRQFMEAVQEGNPDIILLLMLAHSYVDRAADARDNLAEQSYGLLPAFLDGLLEAAGPQVRLIDGNEQSYTHMAPDDYRMGINASRNKALGLVSPDVRTIYRRKMELGFAVYVNYVLALTEYPGLWPTHYLTSAQRFDQLEHNVYHALRSTDEYVWLYSERLSWWQDGMQYPVSPQALEAVRKARTKALNNQPLEIDHTKLAATVRALEKQANPYPGRGCAVATISASEAAGQPDALIDSDLWRNIPPFDPFASTARNRTNVQAASDADWLYLRFECEESPSSKTSPDETIQDIVEVALRPQDQKLPYRFVLDASGNRWDGRGDLDDWNADWRSAVRIGDTGWKALFAIPWQAVGGRIGTRASFIRRHAGTHDVDALVRNLNLD